MKTGYKKLAAAMTAVACVMSMSGCADSGYLMTVDGMDIRNGIYLTQELTAYGSAQSKISEKQVSEGETSQVEDIFSQQIDGKSVSDWIKEETLTSVKRYVAILRLAEQNGVTLTDEELNAVNADVKSMWNDENYYAQYIYGTDTIGEYYESIGIGQDSMRDLSVSEELADKLFTHYYDKDGVTPISDEEFNSYVTDNYASVYILNIPYEDYQGIPVTDEEGMKEIVNRAQDYADRINSGTKITDIQYEQDLAEAKDAARLDAEDEYAERTEAGETLDFDKFVEEAVAAASAEKSETIEELLTVISKENSSADVNVTDFIWNSAKPDGTAAVVAETADGSACCVVVRYDILNNSTWLENNRTTVLKTMKNDDFEALLKETAEGYEVVSKDSLVNGKYAPEKIKGIEED